MLKIHGQSYIIDDFQPFLRKRGKLQVTSEVKSKILHSHNLLTKLIDSDETIYGLNTGFGALSKYRIPKEDRLQLQLNLVRSHATGVGNPFEAGITRIILILKLINFCHGYSGIRWEVVQIIRDLINHDVLPLIPSKGSVGASGDLAPLAHMALTLIGEGEVHFSDRILPSIVALKEAGLEPIVLQQKEGLSLVNGTQVSTALAICGLLRLQNIFKVADIIGAMSVESCLFSRLVFHPKIHRLKKHPGQLQSATNVWKLLAKSEIVASHKDCDHIQDPYSFRCIPHIHGASRELFTGAKRIIENEINSVSDNPLILPDTGEVVTSGHFHAEVVAQTSDTLSIAASEMGAVSERRIARMMEGIGDNIPIFLAETPGIDSGYMMLQVTAASLVSENKSLSHPASVDSLPTSAGKEDFVSMSTWAGRKLLKILENVESILAIELIVSCHALDLYKPLKPGIGTKIARNYIRRHIKFVKNDRILTHEIEQAIDLVKGRSLVQAVERVVKLF